MLLFNKLTHKVIIFSDGSTVVDLQFSTSNVNCFKILSKDLKTYQKKIKNPKLNKLEKTSNTNLYRKKYLR